MAVVADRLSQIPPYLFMELRKKINSAKNQGVDVISLAIGDPVEPTPPSIIDTLVKTARNPENHRYPTDEEKGMEAFREAVARWYKRKYKVKLDVDKEILGLIGAKEGVHHFMMGCVNPGDTVLMTDPGYPAYRANILMAGGKPYGIPILPEHGFLPKLNEIPPDIVKAAKAIFINYPNNPTGACATRKFFTELVEWCRNNNILIAHDNPYGEILFDNQEKLSLMQIEGAKELAVEFNSLSKPFNMTGWRIGMVVGNPEIIAAISKVKENVDSGIFNPIQFAGIQALDREDVNIRKMLKLYAQRRKKVLDVFSKKGIKCSVGNGTFYLWLPTPDEMPSSDFTELLFEKSHVVVAPGAAYGQYGEGFFRISLTVPDERLDKALDRIKKNYK
jgi:LL-diaminopimelate aminotransferase